VYKTNGRCSAIVKQIFSQLGGLGVKLLVYSKCWAVVNKTGLIWALPRDLLQADSTVFWTFSICKRIAKLNALLFKQRFALRQLKEFGFGRKSMESIILTEAEDLVRGFHSDAGTPISTTTRFNAVIFISQKLSSL